MWNWLNFDRDLITVPVEGWQMVNALSQVCKPRRTVASKSRIYFLGHMILKWANRLKIFPCFNYHITVGTQRVPKQDRRHCRRGTYGWSNKVWLRAECDYSSKWLARRMGQLWVWCRSECECYLVELIWRLNSEQNNYRITSFTNGNQDVNGLSSTWPYSKSETSPTMLTEASEPFHHIDFYTMVPFVKIPKTCTLWRPQEVDQRRNPGHSCWTDCSWNFSIRIVQV